MCSRCLHNYEEKDGKIDRAVFNNRISPTHICSRFLHQILQITPLSTSSLIWPGPGSEENLRQEISQNSGAILSFLYLHLSYLKPAVAHEWYNNGSLFQALCLHSLFEVFALCFVKRG